ncbi:MAG TPA: hypothetical protein VIH14_05140 [Anaerolineales bacterium]
MILHYWKKVWIKAWAETKIWLGIRGFIIEFILALIIGYLQKKPTTLNEIDLPYISNTIVAFISLVGLVQVFFLFKVPAEIDHSQTKIIEEYSSNLLGLEIFELSDSITNDKKEEESILVLKVWNSSRRRIVDLEARFLTMRVDYLAEGIGGTYRKSGAYSDEFDEKGLFWTGRKQRRVSIDPTRAQNIIIAKIDYARSRTIISSLGLILEHHFEVEAIYTARILFMGRYEGDPEYHFFYHAFQIYSKPGIDETEVEWDEKYRLRFINDSIGYFQDIPVQLLSAAKDSAKRFSISTERLDYWIKNLGAVAS